MKNVHYVLIDTCVWLDLVEDLAAEEIIDRLNDLLKTDRVRLVVPQVVRDEFNRNKEDKTKRRVKIMADRVKETKGYANRYGDPQTKTTLINELQKLCERIRDHKKTTDRVVARIDSLLDAQHVIVLASTTEVLEKAAMRGYRGTMPFTKHKNSTADAIIIEAYLEFYSRTNSDSSFSFVTSNKKDFSSSSDERRPHKDLGEPFANSSILYSINFADEINRLTKEFLPVPEQQKNLLSDAIVHQVGLWPGSHQSAGVCPACKEKALVEGGWRGHTWFKCCLRCGQVFDTGESIDD
jgi:hypothetical protein